MFVFESSYEYLKAGVKPLPESDLVYNRDYTLSYRNNTSVNDNGNPKKITSVTVKGKGNYQGSITMPFTIISKDIEDVSLYIPDRVYSSKTNAWKSSPVLTDSDNKKLVSGTDYDRNISYTYMYDTIIADGSSKEKVKPQAIRRKGETVLNTDILPVNTLIKVTVAGKGNYEGVITGTYRIIASDIAKATVTIPRQYYTGRPVYLSKSDITVKMGKQILTASDYDIISYSNNTNKGTASFTIKGKGNYGGIRTVKFSIVQKPFGMTIRFDPNGATSGTMNDQIIYKNTALSKNAYKYTGRSFKGWNTKPDGSGQLLNNRVVYPYSIFKAGKTVTLYAVWE